MGESLESKCLYCRWRGTDGFKPPCINCKHNGGEVDFFEDANNAAVEHPEHYKTGKIECIDAMVEVYGAEATKDFCLLNAFKYLWRCKHKGKDIEDIKKAKFYLEKYLEL